MGKNMDRSVRSRRTDKSQGSNRFWETDLDENLIEPIFEGWDQQEDDCKNNQDDVGS